MEKDRRNNKIVIMALVVTILSLSVAFAATLSSTLNINGTAYIKKATWDVYFESATKTSSSQLEATTGPTVSGKNTITYTVTLEENKYFEFDAVIKNDGTYDAKLSGLTLAGAEDYEGLISYTTSGLSKGGTIAAGESQTITVKIAMGAITNDSIEKLPTDKELTLTLVAEFTQAD